MMKKYLKCIKKLQLAKSILVGSMFLVCSSYALADSTSYLKGKVTTFEFKDSKGEKCNFSINKRSTPAPAESKGVCDFLKKAMEHDQDVSVKIDDITHYWGLGSDTYDISVSFLNRKASWSHGNLSKYLLEGSVEDVFDTDGGHCYVAVSGYGVDYNKAYHHTTDMKICQFAQSAFYTGMKVRMIATVNGDKDAWGNEINSFQVTQCCSRSQRN